MKTSEIVIDEEISSVFQIDNDVLDRICKSIQTNGFKEEEPIVIWEEENIIVDGHTRLEAAKKLGIYEVPVFKISFENKEAAKKYCVARQYNRRNLSQADILNIILNLPENRSEYGDGRLLENVASDYGISFKTLSRAKSVVDNGDEETIDRIKNGKSSINKEYNKIHKDKKSKTKQDSDSPDNDDFDLFNSIENDDNSENEISEALGESGCGKTPLSFNHSDGIERPYRKPGTEDSDSETDKKVMKNRESYLLGKKDGFKLGLYQVYSMVTINCPKEEILSKINKIKDLGSTFEIDEMDLLNCNADGLEL